MPATCPSNASAFACAVSHCVDLLQTPFPSNVDQVPVVSCPPDTEHTTLSDVHDASSSLSSVSSSFDGDWNDVSKYHDASTFGMPQLKTGFIWLYQLVTTAVAQVTVIASDVVSLKDRITTLEGIQTPVLVHGQETDALMRQISELCERIAFQEDRITGLERSRRAETDSYKKTIQELTTKLDNKSREDALESLLQSFKNFHQSMECQAARITGVKADTARKIALLQSELADVETELAAVKTVAVPVNASSAS